MLTIKDRFKALGYHENESVEHNLDHVVYQKNDKQGNVSTIEFDSRKIKLYNSNNSHFEITPELLRLLYRQCNEFEWNAFDLVEV